MSDRAAARASITAAAVPVFARYGFRRTGMDLIAQAAGVSRPALYQYFPNKTAVFEAVAEFVGDRLHADAEAAANRGATTAERLYNVLAVKLDFAAGEVAADHRGELVEEAARIVPDTVAAAEARYARLVAAVLAEDPDLDRYPASETAAILTDAMLGIARSTEPPDVMRERLRRLVDLLVRGLRRS